MISLEIVFLLGNWNELFYGNAKLRAGRLLWSKIVNDFHPKNPKSMALSTARQVGGV